MLVEREGAGFSTISPYGVYRARDGEILIGAPAQNKWLLVCDVLEAPELATDERYASNESRCRHDADLRIDMEAKLVAQDVHTWLPQFESAGVATAPMNTIDQVLQDEQVLANDMVVPAKRPDGTTVDLLGLPFKLSGTPGKPGSAPPEPGQHNDSVFSKLLGLSISEIEALKDDGAI